MRSNVNALTPWSVKPSLRMPSTQAPMNAPTTVPLPPDKAVPPMTAAEELIRTIAREVEVTRRLYRSGESEYLIDGQICRLRDIHDLLMDTGLGAKAYAIIEQGKIGMILSTRPTDRRQLIEEAAGVTKYKARRRAARCRVMRCHWRWSDSTNQSISSWTRRSICCGASATTYRSNPSCTRDRFSRSITRPMRSVSSK